MLKKVKVHKRCQGLFQTRRHAFTRLDRLERHMVGLTVKERRIALLFYRLGQKMTRDRLNWRLRQAANHELWERQQRIA